MRFTTFELNPQEISNEFSQTTQDFCGKFLQLLKYLQPKDWVNNSSHNCKNCEKLRVRAALL